MKFLALALSLFWVVSAQAIGTWTPGAWPANETSPRKLIDGVAAKDIWYRDCMSELNLKYDLTWECAIYSITDPARVSRQDRIQYLKTCISNFCGMFLDLTYADNPQSFNPTFYNWMANNLEGWQPPGWTSANILAFCGLPPNFFEYTPLRALNGSWDEHTYDEPSQVAAGFTVDDYGWDGCRKLLDAMRCFYDIWDMAGGYPIGSVTHSSYSYSTSFYVVVFSPVGNNYGFTPFQCDRMASSYTPPAVPNIGNLIYKVTGTSLNAGYGDSGESLEIRYEYRNLDFSWNNSGTISYEDDWYDPPRLTHHYPSSGNYGIIQGSVQISGTRSTFNGWQIPEDSCPYWSVTHYFYPDVDVSVPEFTGEYYKETLAFPSTHPAYCGTWAVDSRDVGLPDESSISIGNPNYTYVAANTTPGTLRDVYNFNRPFSFDVTPTLGDHVAVWGWAEDCTERETLNCGGRITWVSGPTGNLSAHFSGSGNLQAYKKQMNRGTQRRWRCAIITI